MVFHVKHDGVTVAHEDLPRLFDYIGGIVRSLGGMSFIVGGVSNHVHALVSVPPTVAVADFVRTVKAKSSKWIKGLSPRYTKFSWQEGYGAFSVSPSLMDKTVAYIANQEEHHRKKSFREEVELFAKAYKIDTTEGYAFLQ
ncbi:MAG: transposase [Bacteroidales bacterium]|nr:transposase [Bacteroidales bacterium]